MWQWFLLLLISNFTFTTVQTRKILLNDVWSSTVIHCNLDASKHANPHCKLDVQPLPVKINKVKLDLVKVKRRNDSYQTEGVKQQHPPEIMKFQLHRIIFKVYLCRNSDYVNTNM